MNSRNLFSFATSELSQDAFICWLLSWADPTHATSEPALNQTGILLLNRLLDLCGVSKPAKYERVEVKKQFQHIDVLVVINDRLAIIIEDKTFTKHHSGQLKRYLDEVTAKFGKDNVAAIYFKTGDQSSYEDVKREGYAPFLRDNFLKALEQGRQLGVVNHIFRDFEEYLTSIDDAVKSFRDRKIADWDWHCWTGFFMELQHRLGQGAWDYVPNPGGGFMAFWWHWPDTKYLQLEEKKLCFKIEVKDKTLRETEWDRWHGALESAAKSRGFRLKFGPFRSGTWMTVAKAEDDYLKKNADGSLDLDRTIELLYEAEAVFDAAAGTT